MQEQIVRLIKESFSAMMAFNSGIISEDEIVTRTLNNSETALYPEYVNELQEFIRNN